MISRRGIISGLVGIIGAPAIVRVTNLMPVRLVTLDSAPIITGVTGETISNVRCFYYRWPIWQFYSFSGFGNEEWVDSIVERIHVDVR